MRLRPFLPLLIAFVPVFTAGGSALGPAHAQFAPPSTIFGSVTDEAGPVEPGLPVESYIGETLCGKGRTEHTGEGAARVTVYFADVSSREDRPGCGSEGAEVRLKVGDRFAPQTARWRAGPVHVDITFGNVSPAPIPTFTPAPTRTPLPPRPTAPPATTAAGTPEPAATPAAAGTLPVGASPVPESTRPPGGVTSSVPAAQGRDSGDEGGFPLWGVALAVLAVIAAAGGSIGYIVSRRSQEE